MLVSGWTENGTLGSSYINTMGFSVSTRAQAKTTLFDFSYSHYFPVKSSVKKISPIKMRRMSRIIGNIAKSAGRVLAVHNQAFGKISVLDDHYAHFAEGRVLWLTA